MTIDDEIKDKKLQYDLNTEAVKLSALLSGKIDKHEYLTSEQILPSNQRRAIEQGKFSLLWKALEKQAKRLRIKSKNKLKQLKIMENNWLNLMPLLIKMIMVLKMNYFKRKKKYMIKFLLKGKIK